MSSEPVALALIRYILDYLALRKLQCTFLAKYNLTQTLSKVLYPNLKVHEFLINKI